MLFSIIIPFRNEEIVLDDCIKSALRNLTSETEIILIDDFSQDSSKKIVKKYLRDNIKLISNKRNLGVSKSRNRALKIAKGDWIALLDSDDEWLTKKLEKQVTSLKENPDLLFCHTNEIWIRNGVRINQSRKHQKYGGHIFEKCLDICRISPSSALFKKSILDDLGGFDEKLPVCEDYDLWIRIAAYYPVLFLDEPLINKFGGHDGQLSNVQAGIEQYRVQSLEKILTNVKLTSSQFKMARNMLLNKMKIYLNGLKKRDRLRLSKIIEKKIEYWTAIENSLD